MNSPFGFPLGNFPADDDDLRPNLPDHADAFATLLEQAAEKVREGQSVTDVAGALVLPVRIAARMV